MMNKEYKHGWHLIMEYDEFPKGLSEDIVRALSAKKTEPEWLLDFRLRAYRRWLTMEEPDWSDNRSIFSALMCLPWIQLLYTLQHGFQHEPSLPQSTPSPLAHVPFSLLLLSCRFMPLSIVGT